ncbi:MAG: hypothetical protein IGS54_14550 [Elainella sp. C42_A2020_010]|nr:hypothetical protein [Elainella sp. C42_A2020_010]
MKSLSRSVAHPILDSNQKTPAAKSKLTAEWVIENGKLVCQWQIVES